MLARWLAARRGLGPQLTALLGGPVTPRLLGATGLWPDPHAAVAEVRREGLAIEVLGSSGAVRALAQRLLGGPPELGAPRPLTVVEQAIWALVVAAALADLGVDAEAWPLPAGAVPRAGSVELALAVELPAGLGPAMGVTLRIGPELGLRAPPGRPPHAWRFALPVVVGRCALPAASLAVLAPGDVVTLERCLLLDLGPGTIGLAAPPGAVEARVATEYVPRDMALAEDAQLELTVQLGTTRLSLRELGELAIGQVVPLGRPLAGPYEVRVAGRTVGHGELVDIDGELGVRIVSFADKPEQQPDPE